MKKLRIAAIVSLILFFILHVVFEWVYVMRYFGVYSDYDIWILKQYEMVVKWITFPIIFIYLFKKLK
jgi:hypothetical protein